MTTIYALLVGIDNYDPHSVTPIPTLQGCVNDIKAIKDYLKERFKREDYKLRLWVLNNNKATRELIIKGFKEHLSKAKKNDIAFFYYSGHGSQEQAPEEFVSLKLDRLNETLVCYDSRTAESWDLADKELAKLIADISKNEPHISIILDCCHSGSGTRDPLQETGVRLAGTDKRKRPADSFISNLEELKTLYGCGQGSDSDNAEDHRTGWRIPRGRHVLLSACQATQKAKEIHRDGQTRGAFSYYLLDTLKQVKGNLTYQDLLRQTKAVVSSQVIGQFPQLEVNSSNDQNQLFLNGAIAERTPYFIVRHDQKYSWVIDGGAVYGIQPPSGQETTLLALFPCNSPTEDLRHSSKSIGTAEVTQVLPVLSKIKINGIEKLATDQTFKAVITSLPLPPLGVYIEGDEEGVGLARNAMQQMSSDKQPSLYVCEVEKKDSKDIRYRLLCRNNQYVIARPQDDRPLVAQIDGYNLENAQTVIKRLEHISRWNAIAELGSSGNSVIKEDDVKMELIFEDKDLLRSEQMRLEYKTAEDGKNTLPKLQIKLTNNNSQKTLYCSLLNLTDLFAIQVISMEDGMEAGYVRLSPGESRSSQCGTLSLPDELWAQGITEYNNTIKLIVSTSEFDGRLLIQDKLDVPRMRNIQRGVARRDINKNTLNRLMNKVQTREWEEAEPEKYEDWLTKQVIITTIRPLNKTSVSKTESKDLGSGVKLQPHPSLKANTRLTTVFQASRNLGNIILPPILRENSQITQACQFTTSRGTDPGLSVLEFTDVENYKSVSKQDPLRLLVDIPLGKNEYILPIAYDGEFYLPLGRGKRIEEGVTEIKLERLPNPYSKDRSLQNSIWMCFVKVVRETLGRKSKDYHLRAVRVDENQTVTLLEDIPELVKKATKILLYVHGILGDTEDMVKSVQRDSIEKEETGKKRALYEFYDLVLTFDYENINTSISEIARILKQELEKVGLTANHGKNLHIVAHSMGGLVSRWFIEREGGKEVVQHLVMLGTPNAGSPWPTVQDLATLALGIGLNSLSSVAWPVKVLGCLVSAMEAVDVTLDQMKPNSDFLKDLAASLDPGIPYSVIAGNTSIIRAAMKKEGEHSIFTRLIQKLGTQVVEFPFNGQANDIAVTVDSIKEIPEGRQILLNQEVACDHLTYFVDNSEGLEALITALSLAGNAKHKEKLLKQEKIAPLREEAKSNEVTQNIEQKENNKHSFPSSSSSYEEQPRNEHSEKSVELIEDSKQKSQYEFEDSFAIIIGIDNYQEHRLNNAASDAKRLANILKEDYNYKVILLLNEDATNSKLKRLLVFLKEGKIPLEKELLEEVGEIDNTKLLKVNNEHRVLLYFAGHGVAKDILNGIDKPQGWLIPQDATTSQPANSHNSLSMQDFHDALVELACRHMLVILDCCFAASFSWAIFREWQPEVSVNRQSYERFISDPAWQVITSASQQQKAVDSAFGDRGSKDGHSPFALALFKALEIGKQNDAKDENNTNIFKNGIITAHKLCGYLRDEVEEDSMQNNQRQTPQIWPLKKHRAGEYIFLLPNFNREALKLAPALERENNPYRGLESYGEEHSHLFFGRETLTEELYNKVNNNPLTVVTGYSGIGKSSLLKAGLIPYWKKELKCLNKPHDDLNNLLQQSLENQNLIQKLRELIGKLEQNCNLKFKQSEEKLEDLNKTEQEFNKLQKELENSNRQPQVISNQVVEDKESKNNQKLEELKEQLNKKLEELKEQLSKDLEKSKTLWYIKLRIDSDPFQDLENELEKICIFVSHPQNYNNFQQNEPDFFSNLLNKFKFLNLLTRESETASSNINQENINRKLETWKNLNSDIFGDKRLLIIDQFEEITADKRDNFLHILNKIVTEHQEWLRVVLTMPLDIIQKTSIYEYLTKANEFFVEEMRREQLRKAIEGPARIQTMYFESHQNGEDLVNKLLDDVGQTPRLLPLVSYTLHELYEKRIEQFKAKEKNVEDPYDRTFTLIDYNNIGGVKNSLFNQIDSKYEEFIDYKGLSSTYQILVKELFLLDILFRHEIVCLVFIYCNFKVVYLQANSGSDSLILMKYVLKVMCFIEAEEQKSIREEILSTILDLDEKEKNVDVKIYIYILINMCLPELEKDINNFKRSWENSLTWEKTIKNVMLRMVDIRPLSEITRKRVSISKLEYPDNAENERVKKILKEFKELNFLIEHSSEDNHDSKYVELANDIIKEWKNLKEWIASEEENLRHLRREVEFAADSWNNHKKNEDFLWYNNASYLNKLKKISDSDSNWLNQLENEFLQASLQKQEEVKSEKDNLQKCKEALKKDIIEKQQEINNLKKELEKSNLPNTSEVTAYQKELELLESQAKKYQLQLQQLENELEKLKENQNTKKRKKYILSSSIISSALTMLAFWGYSRMFDNKGVQLGTNVKQDNVSIIGKKGEYIEISEGNQVITNADPLAWIKIAGVQAFQDGSFEKAVTELEKYLKERPNDPEALIYLNNSQINKLNKKSYTIAISVPIEKDINGALEMLRGVAQAQDEINKKGGINGVFLKVLVANDNNDPKTAEQIAERLVKNPDVLGVIGHYSSNVTLAAGDVYNTGKLVAISPVSTSVKLRENNDKRKDEVYVFRTVPSDSVAANILADYMLNKLGKKKAAVFYNSKSAYSNSLKSEFVKFLVEQGVKEFDLSDPSFNASQSVQQSINAGTEVLVLLPNIEKLDDILQVVKANNKQLPLLGGDDIYTSKVLTEGADNAVSMVIAIPWHILASQGNFAKTSRILWKADVNWRTAMSYDATLALIEALKNTPTPPTREGLATTLRSNSFTAKGTTGDVKFESGDRSEKDVQLVKIINNAESRSKSGYDFVPNQPRIVKSAVGYAFLRKSPNSQSAIISKVVSSTPTTILNMSIEQNTKTCGEVWYKVKVENKVGWMCSDLLN